MSEIFGRSSTRVGDLSAYDAQRLEETTRPLLASAKGVSWYDAPGAAVDLAVARLCMLRRARSAVGSATTVGDEAVRKVLAEADQETLAWLLSRAISYMDEHGFPELVPGARLEN